MNKLEMAALVKRADEAGKAAAAAKVPVPMYVVERASPLDDNSPIVKAYAPVMGGVCGFATIRLKPANSAFANWLKKRPGSRWRNDSYAGGLTMSVFEYGQSMETKGAYAGAYARVLSAAGFNAWSETRMD